MPTYDRSTVLAAFAELQALDADWAIRSFYVNNTIDAGGYLRDVIMEVDVPGHSSRWTAKFFLLDVLLLQVEEFTLIRRMELERRADEEGALFQARFIGDAAIVVQARDCRLEVGKDG